MQAAADRTRPAGERSPLIAFDLTAGDELPTFLAAAGDFVLRPVTGTTPTHADWSVCDGRHAGARASRDAVGHHRRHGPASPRSQRPARRGGDRRGGVPPAAQLGQGRVPRGRPLLRAVRLPDHHAPAWRSGSGPAASAWPPSGGAGPGACCRRSSWWSLRWRSTSCAMPLFGGPGANGLIDLSGLRGDAIATLLYVNNWHLIYAHQSYFAQFSTPSPLQHTWSLAIEEQFYLVWPLVLLVLLRYGRRGWRRVGVTVTVALGVGSSILMAVLFHPGVDPVAPLLRHRHAPVRSHGGRDPGLPRRLAGAARRTGPPDAALGRSGRRRRPAVFWVRAGTSGWPAHQLHVRGGVPALCRPGRVDRGRRAAD